MSNSSQVLEIEAVIHDEVVDANYYITEEEVIEYATLLGIDPTKEAHLLPLARSWLLEPLPPNWKPCGMKDGLLIACWSELQQAWFYHNLETQESTWEHPLNQIHREILSKLNFVTKDIVRDGTGFEREAPEGESAETTDSVCSVTMLPSSLTPLVGASKTNPPKTLAPLRRVPKLDTESLATPNLSNGLPLPSSLSSLSLGKVPALSPLNNLSKANPNGNTLSFTDRLAAKRATTIKTTSSKSDILEGRNDTEPKSVSNNLEAKQGILRDLNSGLQRLGDGSSGKRVQFSLDFQARGRPELSTLVRDLEDDFEEEISLSESESQPHSSGYADDDLLGLLGDASVLKPSQNSADVKPVSPAPIIELSSLHGSVGSSTTTETVLTLASVNKKCDESAAVMKQTAEEELTREKLQLQSWLAKETAKLKKDAEDQLETSRKSLEDEFRRRREAMESSLAAKAEDARTCLEREIRSIEAQTEQRVQEEKRKQIETLAGELKQLDQDTEKALRDKRSHLQSWLQTALADEKKVVEDQLKLEQAKWQNWLEAEIAVVRKTAEEQLAQARESWQRQIQEKLKAEEILQGQTVQDELNKLRREFSDRLKLQREDLASANVEEVQMRKECDTNAVRNVECRPSPGKGDGRLPEEGSQAQKPNCQCDSFRGKMEVLEAQLASIKNGTLKTERDNYDKLREKYGRLKRVIRTTQAQKQDKGLFVNGGLSDSSTAEPGKSKSRRRERNTHRNRSKDLKIPNVARQQQASSPSPSHSPPSASFSSSSDESCSEILDYPEQARVQRARTRSRSVSSLRTADYSRSHAYRKASPPRASSSKIHTSHVRDGDRGHYPDPVLRAEAFLRRQRGLCSTLGQMSRTDLRSYLKRTAKRSKSKLNFDDVGDLSDTATSGVSSSVCSGVPDNGQEWQTVLHSIQKINSNIQDVWTALGYRHEPVIGRPATAPFRLAYRNSSPTVFLPGESTLNHSSIDSGLSKGTSDSRSLAERTQAIKQWLQQSRSQLNLNVN